MFFTHSYRRNEVSIYMLCLVLLRNDILVGDNNDGDSSFFQFYANMRSLTGCKSNFLTQNMKSFDFIPSFFHFGNGDRSKK